MHKRLREEYESPIDRVNIGLSNRDKGAEHVPRSERRRELHRRRHRREKIRQLARRYEKAPPSEREIIVQKVMALTPGWEEVLKSWGYEPPPG